MTSAHEHESVPDQIREQEFEDLLRRAEALWLSILEDKSRQLAEYDSPDKPFVK
jgi:hypothetical protein